MKRIYIKYILVILLFGVTIQTSAKRKSKVNPNTDTELLGDTKIKEEQNLSITLYFFEENGKKLEDWQECLLKETVEELKEFGQDSYYIIGHVSDKDNSKNKYKLSKRRAIWMSQMLKNYNASADFVTIGKGTREPVIDDVKEEWQKELNNGVEISTCK